MYCFMTNHPMAAGGYRWFLVTHISEESKISLVETTQSKFDSDSKFNSSSCKDHANGRQATVCVVYGPVDLVLVDGSWAEYGSVVEVAMANFFCGPISRVIRKFLDAEEEKMAGNIQAFGYADEVK